MRKTPGLSLGTIFGILMIGVVFATQPARAQNGAKSGGEFVRAVHAVAMQRTLTQQMSKDLLFVAIGVAKPENLERLRSNAELFDRVQKGLRSGDEALNLSATADADVLKRLDQVDELWQLFQTAILGTITTEEATAAQVSRMASLNLPLLAASERALEAYERLAVKNAKGGLFSLLGKAVTAAQSQRMLSQKISKEYLLVGYGHQADRNKQGLQRSIAEFDRILKGLREGDSSVPLIPAPNAEIRAQLDAANTIWRELKPLLALAATGQKPDPDSIERVAQLDARLLAEMNEAVRLYEAL